MRNITSGKQDDRPVIKLKQKRINLKRPKNHCLICRIYNASEELRKHRNRQTIAIVELLLRRKGQKLLKDIQNLCPKATYLLALEEISGKPGFVEAVRSSLKTTPNALTAVQIKGTIILMKKMDLSGYSNPMASIHTTLRRMKDKGEVEESINATGEKAYRLIPKAPIPPASMRRKLGLEK